MVLLALVLAGCPKPKGPGGGDEGGFRVFYPDAGATGLRVTKGSRMQASPAAACTYPDGREARWVSRGARVEQGALPPGLVLEDGAIGGIPTEVGSFTATITFSGVTCAGKPQPDQHVPVAITVR
jgi:hypothetical protein